MGICQSEQLLPAKGTSAYAIALDLLIQLYSSPNVSAFHKNQALFFKRIDLAEGSFTNIPHCLNQCYDSPTFSTSIRFMALHQLQKIKKSSKAHALLQKESHLEIKKESEVLEQMVSLIMFALSRTPSVGYQPLLLSLSKLLNRLGKWKREKNTLLELVERNPNNTHYCLLLAKSFIKFEEQPKLSLIVDRALSHQPFLYTQDDYALAKKTFLSSLERSYFSSLFQIKGLLHYKESMFKQDVKQCFKRSIEVNFNSDEPYQKILNLLSLQSKIRWSLLRLLSQYNFSRFKSCRLLLPYVAYSVRNTEEAQKYVRKIEQRLSMEVLARQQAIDCLLAYRKLLEAQDLTPCHSMSVISKMLNSQPELQQSEQLYYAKLCFREGQVSSCINILKQARTSDLFNSKTDDIDLMLAVSYCSLNMISEAKEIFNGIKVRLGRSFSQAFKQAAILQEKPQELLNNFMNFLQVFSVVSPYQYHLFSDNLFFMDQLPLMMKVQAKALKLRRLNDPQLVGAVFKEIEDLVGWMEVSYIPMRKLYFYLIEIGAKYLKEEFIRFLMYLDYIFKDVKQQYVTANCKNFNHSLLPGNVNTLANKKSEYPSPEFIIW